MLAAGGGGGRPLELSLFFKNDFCNITGSPDCHQGAFDSARRLASEYPPPTTGDDGDDLRPVTPIRARFSGLPGALLSPSQDRGEPVSLVARSTRFSTWFLLKKERKQSNQVILKTVVFLEGFAASPIILSPPRLVISCSKTVCPRLETTLLAIYYGLEIGRLFLPPSWPLSTLWTAWCWTRAGPTLRTSGATGPHAPGSTSGGTDGWT